MPLYEYRCTACARVFESLFRGPRDEQDLACPTCQERRVERLLSAPAAVAGGASPARRVPGCGPVG